MRHRAWPTPVTPDPSPSTLATSTSDARLQIDPESPVFAAIVNAYTRAVRHAERLSGRDGGAAEREVERLRAQLSARAREVTAHPEPLRRRPRRRAVEQPRVCPACDGTGCEVVESERVVPCRACGGALVL